jgi:ligand-binding sensor domain-containing protein
MIRKHLTLAVVLLVALVLASCSTAAGKPAVPAATGDEPTVEPTAPLTATEEPADEGQDSVSAAAWDLSQGRWETYTTDDGLPNNRIRALLIDADGQLWVGAAQGGGRFDGATWEDVVAFPAGVTGMTVDDRGRVWLADGYGVEVYDQGTLTTYSINEGLSSLLTESILVDRDGTVWASAISGDQPGSCVDGEAGGINVFKGEEWGHVNTSDLFSSTVLDVAQDTSGNIWAVGSGGLARFDGAAWEPMQLPGEEETAQVINCVAADPAGRVWFGAKGLGLWVWDGQAWSQYTTADGLAGDTVWAVAFDGAGRTWVGTGGGLSVLEGERWTTYTVADGLAYNDVRAIAFAEDGVWIGTWKGLSHLVFAGSG